MSEHCQGAAVQIAVNEADNEREIFVAADSVGKDAPVRTFFELPQTLVSRAYAVSPDSDFEEIFQVLLDVYDAR